MLDARKTDDLRNSMEFLQFDVGSFVLPPPLRVFAENQVAQGKETLETLSSAVQEACSTSLSSLNEYGQKIAEAGRQDADAVCDCWRELISAKSVPEMMDVWTTRAPRHVTKISNRTGELWVLYWKLAAETAKPIAASVSHTLARSKQA